MKRVVVDSSVVIKWFVVEPHSIDARKVLNDYQTGALSLLAPDLLWAEIGNILWKKQRFHGLAATDAEAILDAFRMLSFSITSSAVLLEEAYHLAVKYGRTVYDALYLALSLRERCDCVTADERLLHAVSPALPSVVWIGDWR